MTKHRLINCNTDSCGEVTELRLAERRLLERERHYHDILHNLSDAIYLVEVTEDNRFRYLETNRAFEAMMEAPEDGMLGKCVGEVLRSSGAEASAEDAVAKFRRCLELGRAISGEIALDTPSGRRILNSTLTPLFDDAGRIDRILGTSRDVTASKQAERLKDFLGFALDQANDAVFLIDPEAGHRFRYVNDQACRSLGYSRDELLNMAVPDIDPIMDLEVARKVDQRLLEQTFVRFETFHRRKDGQVFPVEISGTMIEYGGQTLSLAIVRDISERKSNEQEIAGREQKYRTLAESLPNGIVRYDREGRIRYLNSALQSYLGVNAEEIIGKRPREAWPDGRYTAIEQASARTVVTGESETVEFSEADAAGVLHFNQISIVPERDTDGQIVGTLAIGHDVTAIRQAERKLNHFIASLPGMAYSFRLSPDGHGCMPFASPSIEEYYGLRPEDVMDDIAPAHKLMHPDDLSIFEATFAESARAMAPFRAEYRICRPHLPERWLEARSLPERQADGGILWNGIVLDITERKRAEIALMASERMLSEAQSIAKLGSWDWDVVKNRVEWSDMAYDIYTPDQRPAAPGYEEFKQSVHPDDLERVDAAVRSAFEHDAPFDIEHRVVSLSKGVRTVHAQAKVFRDRNGNPIRMVGTVQDITERKRIELDRKLLTDILEESPDFVGTVDMQGKLGYHNLAARRMVGLPDDADVSKLRISDMHPEWVTKFIVEEALPVVLVQGVWRGETALSHRDGREIPVQQTIMLHRDADGRPMGTSTIMQDISERKRMEQERQGHLYFFESMDRINRALQGSNDLETVLNDVLDALLAIFGCDRAFLINPCDPEAESWSVPFERTRPEYPGALAFGLVMPMTEEDTTIFRVLLNTNGPVAYGPGNRHPLPKQVSEKFGFKSLMSMAIYPKDGKAWHFGIHQCSGTRVWPTEEQQMFQEIGWRITDSLTNLLAFREVREREQKFSILADSMPDSICLYDLQMRKSYANLKLRRILAANFGNSWLGKTPKELYLNGSMDEHQARLEQVIKTGASDDWESSMTDAEYGRRYFQTRYAALRDYDGKIIGALAIFTYITRQRQLELELIRNERKFRTLVKNSPGFIGRFDTELRRTYVNQVYQDATKTSEDEVLGKTPLEYWPLASPNAEEFCTILRRVMATRQQEWTEAHAVTATGSVRYFSMHMVPEFNDDGEIDGVLTTGIEITDMKNAERLKVEAREDERQMLARELHDDLGQRLTALRLDIAALELRFGKGNPDLVAKIRDMDAAVGETVKIVRSLLNMLRPAVLDTGLLPALGWLADEFRKRAQIECRLFLPKQNPALNETQSMAIFRIAQESLTNIVKYAEADKVSIALTPEDGGYRLEIEDDGKGFDPHALEKKTSFGLKGIEERVKILGGKLTLKAAPGRGVKLTVQFAC